MFNAYLKYIFVAWEKQLHKGWDYPSIRRSFFAAGERRKKGFSFLRLRKQERLIAG